MWNRFLSWHHCFIWLSAVLMAALIVATQVQAGSTSLDDAETRNTGLSEQELSLRINNPGSIVERLEEDAVQWEYLFQFPGVSGALKPWYELKAGLDEKYGFRFGISYAAIYKKASDTFGPEDDAASSDLDISGTWDFLGRGTDSPTMLGFDFFWRDTLGTEIPPQALFTQFGSLSSTAAPYGENDPSVGELWIQDKREDVGVDDGWGIADSVVQRFGRFTPFVRYGYADGGANGPTPVKHMASVGLVKDEIFEQTNDRIGGGYTWSDPANRALDNQSMIDGYYRVQVTPEIQVGPTLQVIFDPVNNPVEDTVFIYGIRARVTL